ncbi:MAG: 50S ribosomal protein L3 [bacterium]|jgi:large subunit ribosomal protein L3
MKKGIIGKKVGMTQVFDETGKAVPVTAILAGPCVVIQKKTQENDGYEAVQIGYGEIKDKLVNKPKKGHFAKAHVQPRRVIRELRLTDSSTYNVGDEFTADIFQAGDAVDVSGISKGKGFAGVIKRHGSHRGLMSHGSKYHRRVGSLAAKGVARVFKGRKLPGQMGNVKRTVQNLKIVKVDAEKNLLLVKGSVPGARGSILILKDSVKV